jgi:hypothetical protein
VLPRLAPARDLDSDDHEWRSVGRLLSDVMERHHPAMELHG